MSQIITAKSLDFEGSCGKKREKMRDSVKFQKNSNKKSRKNNHKNGGFEWYRRLDKNAVETMKNLSYGMLSALLKTKKENPK